MFLKPISNFVEIIGRNNLQKIKKGSLIIGVSSYLVLISLSLIEINKARNLNNDRKYLFKKALITAPINGPIIWYLYIHDTLIRKYLLNPRLIIFVYYCRNISFYILIFSVLIIFIKPHIFFLTLGSGMIALTITMQFFFELIVLTDIIQKPDEEILRQEYYKYFRAIQWPLAYGKYFREEIKKKREKRDRGQKRE